MDEEDEDNIHNDGDLLNLNPKFLDPCLETHPPAPSTMPQCLDSAFAFPWNRDKPKETSSFPNEAPESSLRHVTTSHLLNNIAQHNLVKRDTSPQKKIHCDEWRPTANGTWQSIVFWGKQANLDPQQEVAFQILCATCVLAFCMEAVMTPAEDAIFHDKQKNCLEQLARRKTMGTSPLRMFISAPIGSGKRKLFFCSDVDWRFAFSHSFELLSCTKSHSSMKSSGVPECSASSWDTTSQAKPHSSLQCQEKLLSAWVLTPPTENAN